MRNPLFLTLLFAATLHAQFHPRVSQDDPAYRNAMPVRFEASPAGADRGRIPRDPNVGHIGVSFAVGVNGISGDLALPVSRRFDVRIGGSGMRLTHTFHDDTAEINGFGQFVFGRAHLDYYPFGGHLRISPTLAFANFSQFMGSLTFQGGKRFDFGDGAFYSANADPVRGLGRVDTRHTAPGLTVGFNNFTRGYGRYSFPIEVGAVYVGQPTLTLAFTGTACSTADNSACQKVDRDPDFQGRLTDERTRINKDLRFANFLPIVNVGVGYRF